MPDELDLFPLNLVLFPGSWIPLHIFEERYKRLVQRCREERSVFGINLLQGSELCTIGCTARVAEVLRSYEDGRLDIVVAGGRRFRLRHIEERSGECLHGNVEYFDDVPDPEFSQHTFEECVDLYNRIVEQAFPDEPSLSIPEAHAASACYSFVMAQKIGLQLSQKQTLLESQSENERLLILHRHMLELLPSLQRQDMQSMMVRLDGYIKARDTF